MVSLIRRNLILFFGQKSNVFFSLLGAVIAFVLYLVFLKHNMEQSFPARYGVDWLDPWIIGGTLTITAITTTLSALGQQVVDQENGMLADLAMTRLSIWQIRLGYGVSAVIIGWSMQLAVGLIMYTGFSWSDDITIPWNQLPLALAISGFSSLLWTSFNLLCLTGIHHQATLGSWGTVVGTAAGFFAGVYLPMGSLPSVAQTLMKLTPAPYNAALYRQVLLHHQLNQSSNNATVTDFLGIRITLDHVLSTPLTWLLLTGFGAGCLGLALLLTRHQRQTVLIRH